MIYNKMVGGNMKNNKGFTLIEILAVVTIIGLIFILVIPKITTSLKNKKSDVDKTTENLVLLATKLYVSDHSSKFEKTDGNISCMPLHQLVRKGYLDGPVKNVTDDKDITNGKSVRITYDKGFKYELVDSGKCKVYYRKSDYFDNDGNGYTMVEYLESTGTQYIDTGYKPNGNTAVNLKFKTEEKINQYAFLFGSRGSDRKNQFGVFYNTSNNIYYARYGDATDYGLGNYSNSLTRINLGEGIYEFNENRISVSGSIEETNNIYIFGMNTGGEFASASSYKLYGFTITENGDMVRNYTPVIDSDNKPCLFDKVEKKCYYNQGTGEFLWG